MRADNFRPYIKNLCGGVICSPVVFRRTMKNFILNHSTIILIYLVVVNVIAFCIYGIDKHKAKAHRWRIPEHTLIFTAVLGGCIGALSGMRIFHHKTKKPKFKYGVPLIMVMWIVIFSAIMLYG